MKHEQLALSKQQLQSKLAQLRGELIALRMVRSFPPR